jgi:branched-chain amino acid transport system permease protein
MIEAIIAGCALGAVYALASGGLVITYVSSGILNFAYAAIAFFVARFYYFLHVQHGWSVAPAAVLSILVAGPALGIVLWLALFRFIRLASPVIKIVVTIGLAVSIPPITLMLFGNIDISNPPGLAPQPVRVYRFLGAPISLDQILVYACVVLVLGSAAALLRWTNAGLLVRSVVDSDALASLSGVRPSRVAMGVWAVSTFSAGLTGVLAAPIIGLTIDSFTVLIAAAFAAVVAARLRSVGISVFVGLLMGIITGVVERYLPSASQFTADVIPSIPFALLAVFLIYFAIRGENLMQSQAVGGPLDRAISPHGGSEMALARAAGVSGWADRGMLARLAGPGLLLALAAVLPVLLGGVWASAYAVGVAYAVVMLSYTISAGEGGMIWLCQISFAGIGAFTTAVLSTNDGWPLIPAMIVGGLICGVIGALVGLLTIRLGNIYVALATLTFGLLVENLVFNLNYLNNFGAGVAITRSGITGTDRDFAWFALIVFVVLALLFANMRRSTFGMAVTAVRWSDPASRTVGLSVLMNRVTLATFAAFVAGIGGSLLAIYADAAIPGSYATFSGLVWLAVLVAVGVRSIGAALIAGVLFSILPQVFLSYLPASWGELPPALFGLGAVLIARNPEGTLALHARQLQHLFSRRPGGPTAQAVLVSGGAGGAGSAAVSGSKPRDTTRNEVAR